MRAPRLVLVLLVAAASGAACRSARDGEVTAALAEALRVERPAASDARTTEVWTDVRKFYEQRGGEPVWVDGKGPARVAARSLEALGRAKAHGLDPERHGATALAALSDQLKGAASPGAAPAEIATFETQLTSALLALGRDVAVGRPGPPPAGVGSERRRTPPDIVAQLTSVIDEDDFGAWPDAVRPVHPEYAALQKALAASSTPDPRIALNMERWRWMPDDLGARHILVNIPEFQLFVRENGRSLLGSRVIVGKTGDETPIFSAEMTQVILSPYWNIPESIAEGETVPSIVRNAAYLDKNNIEVLRRSDSGVERVDPKTVDWNNETETRALSLRQRPGPGNALGHIKFLMPNKYTVYLHDTPSDRLFEKVGRAFSHGCVRLEEPVMLARYALADQVEWTDEKIRAAMVSGDEQAVTLRRPIPVHLAYFTAKVDEAGNVVFFDDVYRRDVNRNDRQ